MAQLNFFLHRPKHKFLNYLLDGKYIYDNIKKTDDLSHLKKVDFNFIKLMRER